YPPPERSPAEIGRRTCRRTAEPPRPLALVATGCLPDVRHCGTTYRGAAAAAGGRTVFDGPGFSRLLHHVHCHFLGGDRGRSRPAAWPALVFRSAINVVDDRRISCPPAHGV